MLFSDGACSRRVSLFKFFLFSAKMRTAQRERERERKSWELGKSGRILSSLFCFVLCGMPREGGKRGKTTLVFLGNEEKETNFGDVIRIFFQNFFLDPNATRTGTPREFSRAFAFNGVTK